MIRYADPPGNGFLNSTLALPSPGNPGTTLGQQRRNVIEYAASIWGAVLTSNTEIIVNARFADTLGCTRNSAILAVATSKILYSDFPGAPEFGVCYPSALADALAGRDLCADPKSHSTGEADLDAPLNEKLDADSGCVGGKRHWYYGLDHNGGRDLDFLNVLLHEMAHGLGFQTFTDRFTGENFGGKPSVYDLSVLDLSVMLTWREMSAD